MVARGIGTNAYYVIEVDPTTGAIPVTATVSLGDTNYGTVGATTLRTASQIGNATGAADFGQGAGGAQTLRTVSLLSNGTTGAAFGAGATGTTTLRAVLATDQSSIPVTESGTWNITNVSGTVSLPTGAATAAKQPALGTAGVASADVISVQGIASGTALGVSAASLPLPTGASTGALQTTGNTSLSSIDGKVANDFGVSSGAVRTASQVGNTTGAAAFGTGANSAQVLRVTPATDAPHLLATRHEAVATPLAAQLSNGTAAIAYDSGASGTTTVRTVLATRHESASTPISVRLSDGSAFSSVSATGRSYSDSVRLSYAGTSVTTGAWVQLIASTAAVINAITLFDSCGQTLELGTGAAASETRKLIIPPGGIGGVIPLAIPASTRVSIRAVSATCSSGEIDITGMQ
jgi:hypothetical protein